jgi:hypothetical protein
MYYVLNADVIHPETQKILKSKGSIVDSATFTEWRISLGIDYIDAKVCRSLDVAFILSSQI